MYEQGFRFGSPPFSPQGALSFGAADNANAMQILHTRFGAEELLLKVKVVFI